MDNLKQAVITEVKDSQLIHRQQKGAIIRALHSHNLRLLDQPGIEPLKVSRMLRSGKVTVIDVFELGSDQKRAVALYLLHLFHRHKMNAKSVDPGLISVLDEAHRLFPKKAPLLNREYIERVAAKIDNIVHRGRKRKYGVVLATQSPLDVYPLISDLCNTKIAFRLSGADTWTKKNFGKDCVEKVKSLETGRCIINMAGTGLQIPPIEVQIPNVTDINRQI